MAGKSYGWYRTKPPACAVIPRSIAATAPSPTAISRRRPGVSSLRRTVSPTAADRLGQPTATALGMATTNPNASNAKPSEPYRR